MVILLMMALSSAALAQTTQPATAPSTQPSAERIDALLKQLADGDANSLGEVQRQLAAVGYDLLPRLEKLTSDSAPAATRDRALAVERAILEAGLSQPTFVTMHYTKVPPQKVFDDLCKQAHTGFLVSPANLFDQAAGVTINVDRQPFWNVMFNLCNQAGVSPQQMNQDATVTLVRGGMGIPGMPVPQIGARGVVCGPLFLNASHIMLNSSIDLADPKKVQNSFTMNLLAYVEPKIRIFQNASNFKLESAVDDRGNNLIGGEENQRMWGGGSGWVWNFSCMLRYPDHPGSKIASMKGSLTVLAQTHFESVAFADIQNAKGASKSARGRKVILNSFSRVDNDQFTVSASLLKDGYNNADWERLVQQADSGVRLLDADGRSFARLNSGGGSATADRVTYTWTFRRLNFRGLQNDLTPGEPTRFVWDIPTDLKEITLPFELKDVPMP
jgi:hypothetical protein